MKDVEWLKKEFNDLFNGKSILTVGKSVIDEILDQLDKTSVLSQAWIDEKHFETENWDEDLFKSDGETIDHTPHIKVIAVQDLQNQNLIVPKQKLPTVPKFVADFIEKTNPKKSLRIAFLLIEERKEQDHEDKLALWIEEGNSETFARAWLAYPNIEVEKEKRYVVRTNLETYLILDMNKREWDYTSIPPQDDDIQYAYKFDDRRVAEGIAKLVEGKVEVWEE